MIDYKKIFATIEDNLRRNRFVASTSIYKPIDWEKAICSVVYKTLQNKPDKKILFVLKSTTNKDTIKSYLSELNVDISKIVFIHYNYYQAFIRNFYFIILVDTPLECVDEAIKYNKFVFYINSNPKINLDELNQLKVLLPYFTLGISANEASVSFIQTPVKEWRYEVVLSNEDKEQYDKCNEFIKDSINIFGDFNNIEFCRIGDKTNNLSANDCCYNIALNNGWSSELDMSVEFNAQIDKYYNPNAIHERANLVYNIIRDRRNLVLNNKLKFQPILKLCIANIEKKIIIVSKNGDFANELANYLNDKNIKVGMYHNEIPPSYMYDSEGNIITYKSGENKGKPKLFKDTALSNNYKEMFNRNLINVLIIKEASDVELDVRADVIIFTSSMINDIFDFKARYKNITYPSDYTITHILYTKGTIEEDALYKRKQSNLIEVQNGITENNINLSDDTGEINID